MTTLTNIRERIADLAKSKVDVGWFEGNKFPDTGTSVAYVASIQEFGARLPHVGKKVFIPPRPFMRPAMLKKTEWIGESGQELTNYLDGQLSKEELLTSIGEKAKATIVKNIENVYSPPLSKVTLTLRDWKENGYISRSTMGLRDVRGAIRTVKAGFGGFPTNTKPLIDTGFMVKSIGTRIVDR